MSERNKAMVWVKRGLVVVGVLIVLGILVTAIGYRRLHGVPDWYTVRTFTAEQLQAAAQAAENKLIGVQNWAGEHRAVESASTRRGATQQATTVASSQPTKTTVVEFTEDEINAIFQKWLAKSGYLDNVNKYLEDPVMVLNDGRIIVAGKLKDINALASVHFEPKVDEKGNLDLKIVKVLGGNLPLPRAVWSSQRDKAIAAVSKHIPEWRQLAGIDKTGLANEKAITLGLTQILIHVLNNEVSEPVVFLPVWGQGKVALPARLLGISIEEKTLSATVTPMTAGEREAYLKRLKGIEKVNVAVGG